jgi:hypothetical protein
VNGEGGETSFKTRIKKTDKDTLTWQVLEHQGGIVDGPSPVYELKRVKRTKGSAIARGGEPNEHLKGYGPMIGTWRYEGPLLEDVPDVAEKGSKLVFQFTWRRILDKRVVVEDWFAELAGGTTWSGTALIGWNAGDKKLVFGAMSSDGSMSMGTVEFDRQAKTCTVTEKGVDGEGNPTTFKGVVTKMGKDTLTWQALERTGGDLDGPSPVYEFQRFKRTKGKKAAK